MKRHIPKFTNARDTSVNILVNSCICNVNSSGKRGCRKFCEAEFEKKLKIAKKKREGGVFEKTIFHFKLSTSNVWVKFPKHERRSPYVGKKVFISTQAYGRMEKVTEHTLYGSIYYKSYPNWVLLRKNSTISNARCFLYQLLHYNTHWDTKAHHLKPILTYMQPLVQDKNHPCCMTIVKDLTY